MSAKPTVTSIGYVVVPLQPTSSMLSAGYGECFRLDTTLGREKAEYFYRAALAASPACEALATFRDALRSVLEAELADAYDCTRVWSAWGYGTMLEGDFVPVNDRLDSIVDTAIAALDLPPVKQEEARG